MRRFVKNLLIVIVPLIGVGCVTPTGYVSQKQGLHPLRAMDRARMNDRLDAEKKIAEYEVVLASLTIPSKTYDTYADQLDRELKAMKSVSNASLSLDSNFGIPSFFDIQLESAAEIHRNLARAYLKKGDAATAEEKAKKALTLIKEKALSPRLIAESSAKTYALLQEIHQQDGSLGKMLLAKFGSQMMEDYLSSVKGRRDFYMREKFYQQDLKRASEINDYLRSILMQREQAAAAAWNQVSAALGTLSSSIQQANIQSAMSRSGGVVTPEIRMMQFQKMITDFNTKLAKAQVARYAGAQGSAEENSAAHPTMVGQLTDPEMGKNPVGIIKQFTENVKSSTNDSQIINNADKVASLADAVGRTRSASKKSGMEKVVEFVNFFGEFQSQVESLR